MFRRLRTKLTVLYAGLFGVAVCLVAGVVNIVIADNAARTVQNELISNGAVFDRLWSMRASQLTESAELLSRDFGFRKAVATRDAPTIQSALDNLRSRIAIERAFVLSLDGEVVGTRGLSDEVVQSLWTTLDSGGRAEGVLLLDGRPHQGVSAPVYAPDLLGWVVFASELDAQHMGELEKMAAIPLEAEVLTRRRGEAWRANGTHAGASIEQLMRRLGAGNLPAAPQRIASAGGDAMVLGKPLHTLDGSAESLLLLRYPLALAMKPYQPLLASILLIGALGVGLLTLGSWTLARSITRPVAALDAAVRSLQEGRPTKAPVESADEVGRLAHSFNAMFDEIVDRERRITHMALHDAETGLPNRRALEDALRARDDAFVAALAVDRHQDIRHAIGFELTADLIRAVGAKLTLASGKLVRARVAADTIAVLIDAATEDEAFRTALALRSAASGPVRVNGATIDVGLTVGLARSTKLSDLAALERATVAVEQARAAYKTAAVFDAALYGDPARNLSLMSEMMEGIARGHLRLHHQPKFDLRRGEVSGVEALARWGHPDRGRIAPDLFVTMAEETGHIGALTEWTLIQAISDQQRLVSAGHDLMMSVNLSGRLIGDASFFRLASELIADAGAKICFEITETAAMHDPDAALASIERYAKAGIPISIDDYGAGLSSLSYLKRIRASELKLDKSFIQPLGDGQREALLVRSTIDLAHGLGMKVVAEGVETAPVLAMLTSMGCDVAQGYLIGKPMPTEDLPAHLAALCAGDAHSPPFLRFGAVN